jgi:hypothetical protein
MSFAAVGLVLGHLVSGVVHQADEGNAAHVFRLLMAAQIPDRGVLRDQVVAAVPEAGAAGAGAGSRRRAGGARARLLSRALEPVLNRPAGGAPLGGTRDATEFGLPRRRIAGFSPLWFDPHRPTVGVDPTALAPACGGGRLRGTRVAPAWRRPPHRALGATRGPTAGRAQPHAGCPRARQTPSISVASI